MKQSKCKKPRYAAILDNQPVLIWGLGSTEESARQDCLYWTSENGTRSGTEPDRVLPLSYVARRQAASGWDMTQGVFEFDGKIHMIDEKLHW